MVRLSVGTGAVGFVMGRAREGAGWGICRALEDLLFACLSVTFTHSPTQRPSPFVIVVAFVICDTCF